MQTQIPSAFPENAELSNSNMCKTLFFCSNPYLFLLDNPKNKRKNAISFLLLKTQFGKDERDDAFRCVSERVRRTTATSVRHSRADISIIKLPSLLSITRQDSHQLWCSRG